MSEQYEPSYYEIALTGRQVLAGFVILLVCLVAAFFSGVWVGRGGRGDQHRPGQAVAQQGTAQEPRGPELSFFDEKQPAGSRAQAEEGGRQEPSGNPAEGSGTPGSSAQDELAGGSPATPATPPPAEPSTSAGGAAGREDQGSPARRAEAEPAAPPAESSPSGSLATGDVVIQVFSSGEEAKARNVLDLLEKHGFRAFLSPVVDGDRTLYRVRVGPFEHKSEAQAVAEKLHKSLNLETWITQ